MDSIFFVIKSFVITFFVLIFLQVKWGTKTIEQNTMEFIATSSLTESIEEAATGAVRMIRNSWNRVTHSINSNFSNALRSENQPGSRDKSLVIQRSREALQEKTDQAKSYWKENEPTLRNKINSTAKNLSKKFSNNFIDESRPIPGVNAPTGNSESGADEALRARNTDADEDMSDER